MKGWSSVFTAVLVTLVMFSLGQQAGATTPSDAIAPASLGPGPGYELQVSNAVYGFNAPDVNSLPENPTGGAQHASPQRGDPAPVSVPRRRATTPVRAMIGSTTAVTGPMARSDTGRRSSDWATPEPVVKCQRSFRSPPWSA